MKDIEDELAEIEHPGYAHRRPATLRQIRAVTECDDTASGNGRSEWFWFTMPNGDQVFGTYPQGDLYMDICEDQ